MGMNDPLDSWACVPFENFPESRLRTVTDMLNGSVLDGPLYGPRSDMSENIAGTEWYLDDVISADNGTHSFD